MKILNLEPGYNAYVFSIILHFGITVSYSGTVKTVVKGAACGGLVVMMVGV